MVQTWVTGNRGRKMGKNILEKEPSRERRGQCHVFWGIQIVKIALGFECFLEKPPHFPAL